MSAVGQPGYRVKFEQVDIPGGASLSLRSLFDRNQYADPLGEAESLGISSASWPLFGLLWPSGRELAALMQIRTVAGLRVLEVGCGLALASLVVHRRGGDVTASDIHPLAESFLLANLALNGLPPLKYRSGDWNGPATGLGEFDLIIGSDLLYERDQPERLADFVERHAAADAEVLIVDPDRGNRSAFNRDMTKLGFAHSERRLDAGAGGEHPFRGRALTYRRRLRTR